MECFQPTGNKDSKELTQSLHWGKKVQTRSCSICRWVHAIWKRLFQSYLIWHCKTRVHPMVSSKSLHQRETQKICVYPRTYPIWTRGDYHEAARPKQAKLEAGNESIFLSCPVNTSQSKPPHRPDSPALQWLRSLQNTK